MLRKIFYRISRLTLVVMVCGSLLTNGAIYANAGEKGGGSGNVTEPISLQMLSITDFHGYLKPVPMTDTSNGQIKDKGVPLVVGGAAYMATHIKNLQAGHDNSLLFSIGDAFSGWPGESDYFFNEPTIEFLNTIGVDVATIGNHELDISKDFLITHMIKGKPFGIPGVDSSFTDSTGKQFHGSDFEWVSANVLDKKNRKPIIEPYTIKHISDGHGGTIPVGIIGLNTDTALSGMSFQSDLAIDPLVETANRCAKELQDQGVQTIVVLLHEGASAKSSGTDFNGFDTPSGPAIDFAKVVSPAIDAIFTGHWHASINGMVNDPDGNPRPVIEGSNHGRLISEINLMIDPVTRDVIRDRTVAHNYANTRDVLPDPEVEKMVNYWTNRMYERMAEPVADLNGNLTRTRNVNGESTLNDVFADAYFDAGRKTVDETGNDTKIYYGGASMSKKPADFAMVSLSTKSDLMYAKGIDPADSDGKILFGELAKANNGTFSPVVVVTLTGQQIKDVFEQQWRKNANGKESFYPLDISYNVQYKYDLSRPIGERIQPSDFIINGNPIELDKSYRVAATSGMAGNGAGFTAFMNYTDPVRIASWVILDYFKSHSFIQVPELGRVTAVTK